MEEDDLPPDEVRSPQEIAIRALALFGVWGIAIGASHEDVLEWLEDNDLRKAFSPNELKFVDNQHPSFELENEFSWHAERLIVLLWALNLIDSLPDADKKCDTSVFERCLPPFSDQSEEQFVSSAAMRSEDELWEAAERTLDLHWQARDAQINNRKPRDPVDIDVVEERHHAINWVIGYEGLDWDDVTTDT
jgi:hypothetical protein